MLIKMESVACKNCGSLSVVRFGHYRGIQRYWCKVCRHKFKLDEHPFQMKTPATRVSIALHMYYEGMPVATIRRYLKREYGNYPSSRTLYHWFAKYTRAASAAVCGNVPKVGDTWIIDETAASIYGQEAFLWHVIDGKTLFLLATDLSTERNGERAQSLLGQAASTAGGRSKTVATDSLSRFLIDTKQNFVTGQVGKFAVVDDFCRSQIGLYTLQNRIQSLPGFKSLATAQRFVAGWLIHYNYFQQQEALGDRTPAEVAGISSPYQRWDDVIRLANINV